VLHEWKNKEILSKRAKTSLSSYWVIKNNYKFYVSSISECV
jgi:hypothetical protein